MEEWRDIEGYEGYYQVSNMGRVKSLDRIITYTNKIKVRTKGFILSQSTERGGYSRIKLSKNRFVKPFYVHRLVMLSFKGDSNLTVDHVNGIKSDNRLSNLQYISLEDNIQKYARNKKNKSFSEYLGVSWSNNNRKWVADIRIKGEKYYIGSFNSEKNAHKAYLDVKKNGSKSIVKYRKRRKEEHEKEK